MDEKILTIIGIATAALGGGLLITTIIMFFKFQIPALYKEIKGGGLQQRQIEEIRLKNSSAARQRGKVNVFEELEKKAGARRGNTGSLNIMTTGSLAAQAEQEKQNRAAYVDPGTAVLQNAAKSVNPHFIIEKNIMFVSTSEVL